MLKPNCKLCCLAKSMDSFKLSDRTGLSSAIAEGERTAKDELIKIKANRNRFSLRSTLNPFMPTPDNATQN